jgi:hypothetical protein
MPFDNWPIPSYLLALIGLIWYCTLVLVIAIGSYQL